ncbi:hypothetical protein D8O27_24330 [Burkholderia mallei]|uniref:Uncharacterized protein n=1 Tax=Burkholderia mallei TaxID=13373 RepID=A0AAX1X073_BURML|nr:hypothetical protein BMA721280_0187 [Burkholderia mallei 2002721280]EES45061.1 hypothetical protein BMAPRL20_A0105 [Burkholderia mallei PRL-20]RKN93549.1 hypothetical protein D8O31_24415 [Burkholderia mallei]RKN95042.1 hypothetical protein D8O03_24130 [Burkholderia mallei]RKN98474.1 hypothetical protein D8O05_23375 [Burkholderia mallei]
MKLLHLYSSRKTGEAGRAGRRRMLRRARTGLAGRLDAHCLHFRAGAAISRAAGGGRCGAMRRREKQKRAAGRALWTKRVGRGRRAAPGGYQSPNSF